MIALIVLLSVPASMIAQQRGTGDTLLKGTTIEVIQSYKPEVKQLPKIEFNPELPPRDTSRPVFKYEVPQQALNYTYSSLPLRPLALGKDTTELPFPGYLKIGGGNLSTIYFDAGIGNLRGENYNTAIHLHHLSQQGNIKNQKLSLSGVEAEGTLRAGANAWRLSLEGLRNQYHYYGYDHNLYDYSRDTVQQTFTGVEVGLDVKNEATNSLGINYHPSASLSIYSDRFDATERTIRFDVPVSKDIDEHMRAGIGVNGALTQFSNGNRSFGNNVFQITPVVTYRSGGLSGKVGLYPTFGRSGNTFLLPDVVIQFKLPNSQFIISGGWEARLRQNTYKQLTLRNPYLFNDYETRQTRADEVFGMVQSNIGNHITASARVSWWQFNNLPMYLNDTADRKNFYLLYDELINAASVEASLSYQVANSIRIGIKGSVYNYYKSTYNRVWHEPGVRLTGDVLWRPAPALSITAYATILDQIYALNQNHQEVKLDGVFDLGAGAEYLFIPRLSAFINLNNILNDRYQRWYSYEAFGINLFGGLRLKF